MFNCSLFRELENRIDSTIRKIVLINCSNVSCNWIHLFYISSSRLVSFHQLRDNLMEFSYFVSSFCSNWNIRFLKIFGEPYKSLWQIATSIFLRLELLIIKLLNLKKKIRLTFPLFSPALLSPLYNLVFSFRNLPCHLLFTRGSGRGQPLGN